MKLSDAKETFHSGLGWVCGLEPLKSDTFGRCRFDQNVDSATGSQGKTRTSGTRMVAILAKALEIVISVRARR